MKADSQAGYPPATLPLHESSPYAHASGSTAYYSNLGPSTCSGCSFAVRVTAEDAGSGPDQATYPEATSPGGVYDTALGGDYQYEHTYTFDEADTASGTCTVTVVNAMGYWSSTVFTVTRDVTSPTLTFQAIVQGSDVPVTWSAVDPSAGSGVDASTCLLEVREDKGTWQPFSTACAGDDTYDSQPGHTYTFPSTLLRTSRLSASDNACAEPVEA